MPRTRNAGHRAGFQIGAIHDRRVQFVLPLRRKHSPAPRVEQRIVFENVQHRFNGIERRAAPVEHLRARFRCRCQPGTVIRIALRPQRRPLNNARAAMHHDGPTMCLP
jgi:hypothetical protein